MQGKARSAKKPAKPTGTSTAEYFRWDDVQLFLALLRGGSLQIGGRALKIDASTASRRLANLEKVLGVALFSRSRDGLTATDYAEQLRPYAESMEVAAVSFANGAESFERLAQGVVRVSCPPGLADAFVLPALPALQQRFPAITVEIDAQIAVADLARREADIALRTIRPTGSVLLAKKVFATRSVIAGSADYVRKLGIIKKWSDATFIQLSANLAHIPHARWLRDFVPTATIAMVANNFPTQIAAAGRSLGLAVLPRPYLDVYDLVEIRVAAPLTLALESLPVDELWLVADPSVRHLPRVAAVWQFLEAMFTSYETGARPSPLLRSTGSVPHGKKAIQR
jgi:DNA-binding transcriptional LysR family regulator